MDPEVRYQFKKELASRGFKGPRAPNGTMTLDDEYLSSVGVGDLMAQLVLRREKIFHLASVVGVVEAKKGSDDISTVIEALQIVVEALEHST